MKEQINKSKQPESVVHIFGLVILSVMKVNGKRGMVVGWFGVMSLFFLFSFIIWFSGRRSFLLFFTIEYHNCL